MNTIKILNYIFVAALGFFAVMFGIERLGHNNAQPSDCTISTIGYCDDIIGFHGSIPMEINMKDGKIANIIILDNEETPDFMERVINANLVEKFYGLTPKEAVSLEIDAVSGATYSSTAIIKSVKQRMEIYQEAQEPRHWPVIGIMACAIGILILTFIRKKLTANS